MKFPYIGYPVQPSPLIPDGIVFSPEIPISVIGPSGDTILLGLVDTGGEFTLLPHTVAATIGIPLNYQQPLNVTGFPAGIEPVVAYPGVVTFELWQNDDVLTWETTVGFAKFGNDRYNTSGVLGHVGFLQFFTAQFDGCTRQLELTPNASLNAG